MATYTGADKRLQYLFENGGGTEVIANPSEPATDELDSIQIGETVYDIVGGGGAGTGCKKDTLWENTSGQAFSNGSPYSATLSKNISDYDFLIFSIEGDWANVRADYLTFVANIDKTGTIRFGAIPVYGSITANYTVYTPSIGYTDETHLLFATASSAATLKLFKIVGLKFGEGSIIELASCYSTEERQVGCWIDGKPLYQKAYEFSTVVPVSANTYVTIISNSGLNIDTLVNGFSKPSKESTFTPISLNVSNDDIQAYYSTAWSIKYLVIQYTKTTDTAGSGIWTPNGETAVHYSLNEQVVGTWIDGKPLYRKTFQKTFSLGSDVTVLSATDIPDIEKYIHWEGLVGNSFPLDRYDSSNWRTYSYVLGTNLIVYGKSGSTSSDSITLTVWYTKTTD